MSVERKAPWTLAAQPQHLQPGPDQADGSGHYSGRDAKNGCSEVPVVNRRDGLAGLLALTLPGLNEEREDHEVVLEQVHLESASR